jgi:NIMA (never in mitosis gene a)-related kinase
VIKTVNIENMNEEERKEALKECKILQKLSHPNIIKFREVFLSKNPSLTLHLVMDWADAGDLKKKIESQHRYFIETQILDWFTQICLAIKHMHDRKILHRDLKSGNIFLTKTNTVKLGDFGISRCLDYTLEQVQTVTGTPYYLSPEIVSNKPYSFKSDIWSLGVLLYEMCALRMPFNAQSLPKLSLNILKGLYNPIPTHFSPALKSLVTSLLQVDPNKRPSIREILKLDIIRSRIQDFLNENDYKAEFSHTILHNFNKKNNSKNFYLIKNDSEHLRQSDPSSNYDYIEKNKHIKNLISSVSLKDDVNKDKCCVESHKCNSETPFTPRKNTNDINDIKNALAKHK